MNDVNDFSIGIEIDNWGWLDGRGLNVPEDQIHHETRNGKKTWEKYKPEQLEAVDEVIGAIVAKYDIVDKITDPVCRQLETFAGFRAC